MPILKTSKEHFASFFVVIDLLVISVFGMYSNTRIDRSRPKSEDESQIIKIADYISYGKNRISS